MTALASNAIEVTAATFEREVLEASKTVPVLVDFWAPWCGPCKALTPVLEKLAAQYGGRFKLAKIDSDRNPELSATFGVRSIPLVMAFRDGQPLTQFVGALPESQVRAFIESVLPKPSEIEQARGAALRAAGDREGALEALRKALELDPQNHPARIDLAELLIDLGRTEEAGPQLDAVRSNIDWDARVDALRAAISFARVRASGTGEPELKAKLERDPGDLEARFALAELHAAGRRYREALDELVEIVRRDKEWKDGEARKQVLNIFNLAEDDAGLVSEYRKKLASALY